MNLFTYGPPDFTLKSGAKEWSVHKFVLLKHSEQLYTKSTSQESRTGHIELKDTNLLHIDAMVKYMYQNDYIPKPDPDPKKPLHPNDTLDFHLAMTKIGQTYTIPGLTTKAVEHFSRVLAPHRDLAIIRAVWPGIIRKVYTDVGTPKAIKDGIVKTIVENMYFAPPGGVGISDLLGAVEETPEFAVDALQKLMIGNIVFYRRAPRTD